MCWKIHTDVVDARIVMDMLDTDIEDTPGCTDEYIALHDGKYS